MTRPSIQVYRDYEDESYGVIMGLIDTLRGDLPKEIFTDFAQKIYKRNK